MADPAVTISLKGGEARWRGLGDESTMLPGAALFSTLQGCYVSKDGTELRSIPGHRLGGRPFFGQQFDISAMTSGASPTCTISSGLATTSSKESCYLPSAGYCYIFNSSDVTSGIYSFTRTDVDQITVVGATSGGTTGDGVILIQRAHKTHALTHIGDHVVAVGEMKAYRNGAATAVYNVGAAVSTRPLALDTDSAGPPGPAAQAADEDGFLFWPSPTMTGIENGVGPEDESNLVRVGSQEINMSRRLTVDVLNRKVVVAVPGSGCLWQVDVGHGPPWNTVSDPNVSGMPNHRWTKALGIPKGQIKSVSTSGNDGTWAIGWYAFGVAYWDPATGEIGLMSDPVPIESASSGAASIEVQSYYPRAMLYETVGLGIVLFMTAVQTTQDEAYGATIYPVDYSGPWATANDRGQTTFSAPSTYTETQLTFTLNVSWRNEVLNSQQSPQANLGYLPNRRPVLEQLAPGGACVRTVKGRVLSGGALPVLWDMAAWPKRQSDSNIDSTNPPKRTYLCFQNPAYTSGATVTAPAAHGMIPSSYAGHRLQADLYTNGTGRGTFVRQVNRHELAAYGLGGNSWLVDFYYGDIGSTYNSSTDVDFEIQAEGLAGKFSEEKYLGVVPANNTLEMDSRHGSEVQGIGRIGDAAFYMTPTETFLFGWNAAPRQSSQMTVSNRFGCAAPGSVVDGPFGCVWMSREGPVAFDGQRVTWIGRKIRDFWKTVQKDQNGDVWYCTGMLDIERQLVIWTLTIGDGSWDATDPNASSKWSPNYFLFWAYETGEFSTQPMSGARVVDAVGTLPYREDDGTFTYRPSFTCSQTATDNVLYHPIYGWDEDALDRQTAATAQDSPLAIDAKRTAGSAAVSVSSGASNYASGDYGFIRSADGQTIKWFGTFTVDSDVQVTLDGDDGAHWESGDKFVAGVLPMRLTTHRMRVGDTGNYNNVDNLIVRANISASNAYAKITVTDENGNSELFTNYWGDRLEDGVTRFPWGGFQGKEAIIDIQISRDGPVFIKDITLEIQSGE